MDAHKGAVGGGGGEVRRINVVYFLSRGGRTDHPHLFRVNHLNRAGVRLRGKYVRPFFLHLQIHFHLLLAIIIDQCRSLSFRSDVKRWLSELRGKDMPDNYSWSYKR